MIWVHPRNFFVINVYNFDEVTDFYDKEIPKVDSNYTMRFYFGFQNFFLVGRLAIKLFFDISTDLSQKYYIFLISHHLQSKKYIHLNCRS